MSKKPSPSISAIFKHLFFATKRRDFRGLALQGPLLIWQEFSLRIRSSFCKRKRVFSLDFHASVIEDLKQGFKLQNVEVLSWIVSFHARNFRKVFRFDDPVKHLHQKNWRRAEQQRERFLRRYDRMLRKFDGFVVSYPTSYFRLFIEFGKPILILNPIRYEHPFTFNEIEWSGLDRDLRAGIDSGQITFIANNRADQDYASHFLEREVGYCPSLCDYVDARWEPGGTVKAIYDRRNPLGNIIQDESHGAWKPLREVFGARYKWAELASVREIVVIPYAPSTMFLFELATIGVPVAVPSREFMHRLVWEYPGVMEQSTFSFMERQLPRENRLTEATNWQNSEKWLDWWLDRSDFYDQKLMPNVRQFSNLTELFEGDSHPVEPRPDLKQLTFERNEAVYEQRQRMLQDFVSKC